MTQLTIKTGTEEDFFKRGRQLAKAADRGEQLPIERIISFEDPADVMKLITAARLALFHSFLGRARVTPQEQAERGEAGEEEAKGGDRQRE